MPERGFLIVWFLFLFFLVFSCPDRVWTEFGSKFFFFLFLGLSYPVLAKNNAGKGFFNFLNFFAIFFGTFLPGSSMNGIRDKNCFFSFSAYLIPFWLKIMPEIGILIFLIFFLFFSEFSCPGRVWTNSGLNFFSPFLRLSHPILSKTNAEKRFFHFLIFCSLFFFGIFLPGSSMNGIQE